MLHLTYEDVIRPKTRFYQYQNQIKCYLQLFYKRHESHAKLYHKIFISL